MLLGDSLQMMLAKCEYIVLYIQCKYIVYSIHMQADCTCLNGIPNDCPLSPSIAYFWEVVRSWLRGL